MTIFTALLKNNWDNMILKSEKLILILLLTAMAITTKAQNDNIIDKVVWVVGEESILKSDVEEERLGILARGERIEGDPYCFIPEQLALRKLYLDQAKIDSIEIPTADLNREVARQEKLYIANAGSKEKLEEYMSRSMIQIREHLFEQIKTGELMSEVQRKLTKNIKLTPSEVRKYYSQLPPDSLPYIETTVEVQILTNEPQIPLKETDIIKGRLRDFRERVLSGETDFATLAILYSEDGSAQNGGELGFMGRAELDPAFASEAFSLQDSKKVSNIVESEFGFHIIQLIERRGDRANFRHILLRPRVPQDEIDKSKKRLAEIADSIRAKSFTFEEAVEFLSFDKDTRKSEGLMVNTTYNPERGMVTTSKFKMEDLPPEISRVVDTMKVGDLSAPFLMKNTKTGKDVVAFVKLKSRTEGHIANVSDDYEDLRVIVEAKKREEILKKWVQRKIRDVYVYIDPEWRNCDFQYEGWLDNNDATNN